MTMFAKEELRLAGMEKLIAKCRNETERARLTLQLKIMKREAETGKSPAMS